MSPRKGLSISGSRAPHLHRQPEHNISDGGKDSACNPHSPIICERAYILERRTSGRSQEARKELASLHGSLEIQIGPGNVARMGRGGELMARILSLTSLRGILTASVFDDFANKGRLPYERMMTSHFQQQQRGL